jgi:SAM-dependent methyltransferase
MEPDYFDALYASDADPWRFASSEYERAKYEATLHSLPKATYDCALEVGCSIGVFTRLLAGRCNRLLGIDPAERALASARQHCAENPNVGFAKMAAPDQWPVGAFDLIILSEVVYYFNRDDVVRLTHRVKSSLLPHGDVVLVHWLGQTDYPLSGDEAVTAFRQEAESFAAVLRAERRPEYRLDVLRAF